MPFIIKMPKLSPTMEEGTITKWHKKEGDFVNAGEILVEIATDKATVEHTALDEGWLRKILVSEGQHAIINQEIAIFSEKKDEPIESFIPQITKPSQESPLKEEKAAPKASEEKPKGGFFEEPAFSPPPPLENYVFNYTVEPAQERIKATPLAKRLAKENHLDLASIQGHGPGGRITSKDLALAKPDSWLHHRTIPQIAPGTYEEVPLTPVRKVIAKRLQESKTFIPHFYVKQEINAEPLFLLREQLKMGEIKVTYNDLIVKAVALGLRKHPTVNAGFNSANKTITLYKTIDVAVAVSIDGGLITPILRHADYKDVVAISQEVRLLAQKAKKGQLQEHEYKGGSFCVSNLGMYGITEFSAVINPPQGAILAVGGITEKAIVKNGAIIVGKTIVLTLSCDHRVIDGALGAEFLKTIQWLLENPALLLV